MQGSVRGESGDRLSYRVAIFGEERAQIALFLMRRPWKSAATCLLTVKQRAEANAHEEGLCARRTNRLHGMNQ